MTTGPLPPRGQRSDSRLSLLGKNLLYAMLIFALLEIWRPCYFLTDDNLSAGLPFFTGMGRRLLHGQSPFVVDFLFGGNYNALRDPAFFSWHPLYMAASLLEATPAHFLILDVDAFVLLLLTAAGFVTLGAFLRRELGLPITDGWLTFLTMSYTYSFMALTAGASWLTFLGNHSALPWLALGLFQREFWRGFGLITLFALHMILGGHFAPFIATSLFFTLFAAGIAWWRRSAVPLASWFLGFSVAVLIVSPLLFQAIQGFAASSRSEGISIDDMQNSRVPLLYFPGSYLFGTGFWLIRRPYDFHVYHPALAACAAAWCIFPALASRGRWHFLEALCGALIVLIAIFVIRPAGVSEIMTRLPLLRSLRMPFRELLEWQFFLHLFLVLRLPAFSVSVRRLVAGWSALVFVVPMLLYAAPSFNPMAQQRRLIFSGDFDRYWAVVKAHLSPTDRFAAVAPDDAYRYFGEWAPFSLLGTHDFCGLAGVVSASGYSPTAPTDELWLRTRPAFIYGYFVPSQIEDLWRERPDLKLIVMESRDPIRITLRSRDGTVVDLTPYIPNYVRVDGP